MSKDIEMPDAASGKMGPSACVQEVHENADKEDLSTYPLWKPQELRRDTRTEKFLVAYDCFLCAIPTILIVKTILCIVASRIDKAHKNIYIDSVSRLTIFLVNFNGQVRSSAF